MGASGAQLGTRFAAATESIAHPNFKKAFIRANARDAMPSIQLDERFPVIPVRGLVNEGTKRFLRPPGRHPRPLQRRRTRPRKPPSSQSSTSGRAPCAAP